MIESDGGTADNFLYILSGEEERDSLSAPSQGLASIRQRTRGFNTSTNHQQSTNRGAPACPSSYSAPRTHLGGGGSGAVCGDGDSKATTSGVKERDGTLTLTRSQRAQLSVARALVGNPTILLMDDVCSNLDSLTRATLAQGLKAVSVCFGMLWIVCPLSSGAEREGRVIW